MENNIEEDFTIESHSNIPENVLKFMDCIQDIIIEDEFAEIRETFFEKYSQVFEDKEENKLEYMDIYKEYVQIIEGYMVSRLNKLMGFDYQEIIKDILKYKDSFNEEILELLSSFSDYSVFKEMILDYKRYSNENFGCFDIGISSLKNVDFQEESELDRNMIQMKVVNQKKE